MTSEPTAETKREAIVNHEEAILYAQMHPESNVCRAYLEMAQQPRYTIDQIIDGLRLEWALSSPSTAGVFAESCDGWYLATPDAAYFRRSQECAWTVIRESLGTESNKSACLADYKSRVRAVIEGAVKHGAR